MTTEQSVTPRRQAASRVTCTHVKMGLIRADGDDEKCDLCGRSPHLRSFYVCQQDEMPRSQLPELTKPIPQDLVAPLLEMQQLGMSQSIIDSAIRGSYNPTQIEKLIIQRKNVLAVIEQQTGVHPEMQHSHSSPTTPQFGKQLAIVNGSNMSSPNTTPFGYRYSLRLRELANKRAKQQAPYPTVTKCDLKFCSVRSSSSFEALPSAKHRNKLCRPYYKDRAIPTIDAILAADTSGLNLNNLQDIEGMFRSNDAVGFILNLCSHVNNCLVSNAQVVRQLGLPKPTPLLSRYQGLQTAPEETPSAQTTTTSSTSSSYQEALNTTPPSTLPAGSSPVVDKSEDKLNTVTKTSDWDRQTDIHHPDVNGRWREISSVTSPTYYRQLSRAAEPPEQALLGLKGKSPHSLPRLHIPEDINRKSLSIGLPYLPFSRENEHISGFRPVLSRKSSKCSSSSGEVEVEGGLALTEEAIETGTPDIITQV